MKKSTLKPIEQAQQKQVAGGSVHDNGVPACEWWLPIDKRSEECKP